MKKTAMGIVVAAALTAFGPLALAAGMSVTVNQVDNEGVGKSIGTIRFEDSKDGLVLKADLSGLTPGIHGMHLHENADCGPKEKDGKMVPGLAAGGHFDPDKTGKHEGPKGHGHLGDLPPLDVDAYGNVNARLLAPRLKMADLTGHAVIIHDGADNFSDTPKPLGGGGGRVACAAIK